VLNISLCCFIKPFQAGCIQTTHDHNWTKTAEASFGKEVEKLCLEIGGISDTENTRPRKGSQN
jgi:hypothetical protein